jgi:hypothetical protein
VYHKGACCLTPKPSIARLKTREHHAQRARVFEKHVNPMQ